VNVTSWLFLVAYTCSGLAGLVYEVTWTRLLTLYLGHTTAAASAVVAAFLGGLAIGAAVGGRFASSWTPRRCLKAYVALEIAVAICAVLLPGELTLFSPVLRWAYNDAAALFPLIRILSCVVMVMLPALALGATFPMAIRWFARGSAEPARESSRLYFVNTVGAAVGALLAGFVLIPSIGMSGTIDGAMAGSIAAAGCVLGVLWSKEEESPAVAPARLKQTAAGKSHSYAPPWLAMLVLGASGFAALVHEIAWTRILSLVLGPTTYAFAATLAAVIAGVAIGSGIGAWLVSARPGKAAGMLAFTLSLAAVTASWTYAAAGSRIPMMVARHVADFADFDQLLWRGVLFTMALILPTSACLGAAFPFAMALVDDRLHPAPGRFVMDCERVPDCLHGRPDRLGRAGRPVARGWTDHPRDIDCARRHQPALGSRVARCRRLHVCAVRAEGSRSRNAAEGRRASLLRGGRRGDRLSEEADGDDDACC